MKTLTRTQAIDALREELLRLTDDEHSICEVAARKKIFCGGFARWSSKELKERYGWIVSRRPRITRRELEDLANRWQLARQDALGTCIACDTQLEEKQHRTCLGWDTFSDEDLAAFVTRFCGEEVRIVADEVAAKD